jgi:hypothetical protein
MRIKMKRILYRPSIQIRIQISIHFFVLFLSIGVLNEQLFLLFVLKNKKNKQTIEFLLFSLDVKYT